MGYSEPTDKQSCLTKIFRFCIKEKSNESGLMGGEGGLKSEAGTAISIVPLTLPFSVLHSGWNWPPWVRSDNDKLSLSHCVCVCVCVWLCTKEAASVNKWSLVIKEFVVNGKMHWCLVLSTPRWGHISLNWLVFATDTTSSRMEGRKEDTRCCNA